MFYFYSSWANLSNSLFSYLVGSMSMAVTVTVAVTGDTPPPRPCARPPGRQFDLEGSPSPVRLCKVCRVGVGDGV
jgi:hypothetical protein